MKNPFRTLQILFLALLLGQVLFAAVVWFLNQTEGLQTELADDGDFQVLAPIVLFGAFMSAYLINRMRLNGAPTKGELNEKMAHYRITVLIRLALLEGGNLFCIVAYLLAEKDIYLMYFALGIAAFLLFRPTMRQLEIHYLLSGDQLKELTAG